jgi:tripartite-type tricarboxylate transporter receptor subunit TctC
MGFAPGASGDIAARVLAQALGRLLGQQFIVENRTGAGSNIATTFVARAPKDGYTLLQGTVANTINPVITPNLPFDFAKDFAPISLFTTLPNIVVTNPSLGVRSVQDLIKLARDKPGQLSYGSAGVGGISHFGGELFNAMAGIKLVHVPYKGVGAAFPDLIAGRTPLTISSVASLAGVMRSKLLRPLAVTTTQRTAMLPDVPTMIEAGIPGFVVTQWHGIVAPAGTPRGIVDRLQQGIARSLEQREVVARLAADGTEAVGSTPQQFAAHMKAEREKWTAAIRQAGISMQ